MNTEEERLVLDHVQVLRGIPGFVRSLTGGLSSLELAGRVVNRSVQLAELLISLRERGHRENEAVLVAGSLAQVSIFLLALADSVGVDLLAATAIWSEGEKKARDDARQGITVPPANGFSVPN